MFWSKLNNTFEVTDIVVHPDYIVIMTEVAGWLQDDEMSSAPVTLLRKHLTLQAKLKQQILGEEAWYWNEDCTIAEIFKVFTQQKAVHYGNIYFESSCFGVFWTVSVISLRRKRMWYLANLCLLSEGQVITSCKSDPFRFAVPIVYWILTVIDAAYKRKQKWV